MLDGRDRRYCGELGWQGPWVVCAVVDVTRGSESTTGQYVVLDTSTGVVEMVPDRAVLAERLRDVGVDVPALAGRYPSTNTVR